MLRLRLGRFTPAFLSFFDSEFNKYDKTSDELIVNKPLTGLERLKKMFCKTEYGDNSIELHTVVQMTITGAFAGACAGGIIQSKEAYTNFINNNQATIFKSTLEAQKKLQDYVTVAFAKGAVHWGWRLALFTSIFGLVSTMISVYRGEPSVIDYTIAGAVTGAVYRANLGLAASVVAAGLGSLLSTAGGIAMYLILAITGLSLNDIKETLYKLKQSRESQMDQAWEKSATIKNDRLTDHHKIIVNELGEKKLEEF